MLSANEILTIHLNPNFGQPLKLAENAATIAIGDPNLIDIVTVEPNLLMVTGQKVGATSLTVFGKSGTIYQFRVQVTSDVTQLRNMIQSIEPNVQVDDINGKVILRGEVKTPAGLSRVLTVADRFFGGTGQPDFKVVSDQGGVLAGNLDESLELDISPLAMATGGATSGRGGAGRGARNISSGRNDMLDIKANLAQNISRASVISVANGKVLSLIKVTSQPKIEIQMRIVEIDRTKTDQFGIDWRLDGNKVTIGSTVGRVTSSLPSPANITDGNGVLSPGSAELVGIFTPGKYFLTTFINAMEEKGATSTLSEPLLTAISGESARFMVGGTVPIPFQTTTSSTNSVAVATNVRYETFGLNITVRPTVLENGKISIILDQAMSELDYSNAIQIIGAAVPGFKQKTVSTVTESESGETWAVAGLLTEEDRKNLKSVPWISKVPILGKLFDNKDDSVSRNELIILVNARRVDGVNTTTTNFDGMGNLEPQNSKNQLNPSQLYSEKLKDELNSQNLNQSLHKMPSKPNNDLEKDENHKSIQLIKDENKTEDANKTPTKEKSNGLNSSKKTKKLVEKTSEQNAVKIVHLKEKRADQDDVKTASSEQTVQKANRLDDHFEDAKIFSFDVTKIINDVSKQPQATAENANTNQPMPIKVANVSTQTTQSSIKNNEITPQKKTVNLDVATEQKKTTLNESQPENINTVVNPIEETVKTAKPLQKTSIQPTREEELMENVGDAVSKRVNVVVINFLTGHEKTDYFNNALKKGLANVPPKSQWQQWRVGVGAVDGNAKKLVNFLVSPDMRNKLYSGAMAYIEVPKNQFNYVLDY